MEGPLFTAAISSDFVGLLPTRSEGRDILRVRSIPVAALLSCQDVKNVEFKLHKPI